MSECIINRSTIAKGIQEDVNNKLLTSNLFKEEDELFFPKDPLSNYKELVNSINEQWGEDIILRFNGDEDIYMVAEPSYELTNKYINQKPVSELNKVNGVVMASNGKPSILHASLQQALGDGADKAYQNTKTAAFKKWFGDSKVVDENGEPLVVYHASPESFEAFNSQEDDYGFNSGLFFTDNPEYLKELPGDNRRDYIYPVFLKSEKLLQASETLSTGTAKWDREKNYGEMDGLVGKDEGQKASGSVYVVYEPNQVKSISNRGSFLTDNPITIQEEPVSPEGGVGEGDGLSSQFIFKKDGEVIGDIHVSNDGEYLTVYNTLIQGGNSNGTYSYLKLADYASQNGLTLRSDTISNRMSSAAKALWSRFVNTGQAFINNGRYIFSGESSKVRDNIYMSANEALSKEEDAQFHKLQDMGLISKDAVTTQSGTYYQVPNNPDQLDRLRQILSTKKIDYIQLNERGDTVTAQLGRIDSNDKTNPQESRTRSSKASAITKGKVLSFLNRIGFTNIQEVNQLTYKGERIEGSAYVDLINGIMQIVKGEEDYTLPEESMHILTHLLENSNKPLFRSMMKDITSYKIYGEVLRDPAYSNNKLYQKEDGTIDYDKIKKEAIAKLLAEMLISNLENTSESARRKEEVYSWWRQLIKWIRDTFTKYENPFAKALEAMQDEENNFSEFIDISADDIFLSAKSVNQIDKENPTNRKIFDDIINRPVELNLVKVVTDDENSYYQDGNKIEDGKRVSDITSRYNKALFKGRNFDEALRDFYEQSRKDGDYLHEVVEEIINSYIDPATGLMRRNPGTLNFPLSGNPIQGLMVKELTAYFKKLMASYQEGTRFMTEQVVYDPDVTYSVEGKTLKGRIGTIDFMAILPDGTVDLLDWKTMLMEDLEGAKDYKKDGIYLQINEYIRMLKDQYGVTKFGKIRAIPIKKTYTTNKTTKERTLKSISIGDSDASKIKYEQRQLRPIISPLESAGSDIKDEVVTKLQSLYQRYIDKGYFKDEKNILSHIQEAIYEIRTSNSVDNLANYFSDIETKIRQLLLSAEQLKNGTKEDISESLAMIKFYEDILENIVQPSSYLQQDPSINEQSRVKAYTNAGKLMFMQKNLRDMRANLLEASAKKDGIFGLLLPEKVVNIAARYFRSLGSQNMSTMRYAYELVKKAYGRLDIAADRELKNLKELKHRFDTYTKVNGLSAKEAISKLVNMEKGRLYSKIDKAFFEAREAARESADRDKILKFVTNNYDLTEYTAWYNQAALDLKAQLAATTYDVDKKIDARIKRQQVSRFESNYNISKNPVTAFGKHNSRLWGKNILEDKWLSAEYQELSKPGNEALMDMYNYMVSKNKELADVGAIDLWEAYTFLPNIRKGLGDILNIEDGNALSKIGDLAIRSYNDWRKSITVDDYELNFQGQRDPFTGEKLQQRFVPFVGNIDAKEKSYDIFSIYALMAKEINKEKYLQENDEILRSLVHLEKAKPTLLQNKFGTISEDANGKPQTSTELGRNVKILEEQVKAIANGEKIQYDADFAVSFRMREKWNKSAMGKLYQFDVNPEAYNPTNISATKFLMWLNTANQKRILGVNAASAISNLFGGTYSSNKLFQKYVSKEDLNKAWTMLTSGGFYQSDEMKKNAALVDYFLPLLQNREAYKASQLSVSGAATILSQEWLMAPMRKTSEIVQLNIFLALIQNTALINGEIVNIRDHIANEIGYYDRYSLPTAEREKLEKDYNEKVKAMKDSNGLIKLAQYKTIQEAGKDKVIIELPGIDRASDTVAKLREISQTMSKDSLGEADEFDIANYKFSIWWRLFMTFKNWIPRMADVRFGEFRPDQAHQSYEYGRLRMFYRSIAGNYLQTAANLVPIPYLTGKVTSAVFGKDSLIKSARRVYAEKKAQEMKLGRYNKDTFITEGEFVDKFIQGTEATQAEIRTLLFMMALIFSGIASPDDDDDPEDRAVKRLITKQANKLIDEVGFFYSPSSGIDIAGGGAPVFGIVKDGYALGNDVAEQFFGFTFEQLGMDEKGPQMQKQARPIKRTFKMFPVLKEILTYLPAVDNETAKEWGVKVNDRRAY